MRKFILLLLVNMPFTLLLGQTRSERQYLENLFYGIKIEQVNTHPFFSDVYVESPIIVDGFVLSADHTTRNEKKYKKFDFPVCAYKLNSDKTDKSSSGVGDAIFNDSPQWRVSPDYSIDNKKKYKKFGFPVCAYKLKKPGFDVINYKYIISEKL